MIDISRCGAAVAAGLLVLTMPQPAAAALPGPERISVSVTGGDSDWFSNGSSISDDGRLVVFQSYSTDLVPRDINGGYDSFVRDRQAGVTRLLGLNPDGSQTAEGVSSAVVSGDGRWVVYDADAATLVSGDSNNKIDVFVEDLGTGAITRVSVTSSGAEPNNHSHTADISPDGRFVTFQSTATNLLTTDLNGATKSDVYLHDRLFGSTRLVSEALTGGGAGADRLARDAKVSADGRYVAFMSAATNLVADGSSELSVFVRDMWTGVTTRDSLTWTGAPAGYPYEYSFSRDGRFVGFDSGFDDVVPGDTNNRMDAFVRDRWRGTTELVSVSSGGGPGNAGSHAPQVGDGGRCVVFTSDASDLAPGDTGGATDVFVRDMVAGTVVRISAPYSADTDRPSYGAAVSRDGRHTSFDSQTGALDPNDTNDNDDVYAATTGCG